MNAETKPSTPPLIIGSTRKLGIRYCIKFGAIETPFTNHARNFMDAPPRLPTPIYAPDVPADNILFACWHSRRTLYAADSGSLWEAVPKTAPRIAD